MVTDDTHATTAWCEWCRTPHVSAAAGPVGPVALDGSRIASPARQDHASIFARTASLRFNITRAAGTARAGVRRVLLATRIDVAARVTCVNGACRTVDRNTLGSRHTLAATGPSFVWIARAIYGADYGCITRIGMSIAVSIIRVKEECTVSKEEPACHLTTAGGGARTSATALAPMERLGRETAHEGRLVPSTTDSITEW